MAQRFINLPRRPRLWLRVFDSTKDLALGARQQAGLFARTINLLSRKRRLAAADMHYRQAVADLLNYLDLDAVDGLYLRDPHDQEKDVLLSIYPRAKKADIGLLRQSLSKKVADKVIHTETHLLIVFPGNRASQENRLRKAFNNLANNLLKGGYVDNFYVLETAEETQTRDACRHFGEPFPEAAFPPANVVATTYNPRLRPLDP